MGPIHIRLFNFFLLLTFKWNGVQWRLTLPILTDLLLAFHEIHCLISHFWFGILFRVFSNRYPKNRFGITSIRNPFYCVDRLTGNNRRVRCVVHCLVIKWQELSYGVAIGRQQSILLIFMIGWTAYNYVIILFTMVA